MSPARKTKRKRKPASPPPRSESPVTSASTERSQRLGAKHLCFSCGLKFYDLNRPEPVCPRCGANQREKPKNPPREAASPPPPPKQPRGRDITPLLADDDDESVNSNAADSDDVDLDIGELEKDASLFDETESEDDSDDED
jgi:predicted  nucleic acid-binding Zn-ribbon protein